MAVLPPDPVYILRETNPIHSLAFHKGWERLLCGDSKGKVNIWSLQTNRRQISLPIGDEPICGLYHTSSNLITQLKTGTTKIWDLGNKGYDLIETIQTDYVGYCKCIISEPNNAIIVPENHSTVQAYTFSNELIREFKPPNPEILGVVMCVKLVKFGESDVLLVAYEGGVLKLWDFKTAKELSEIKLNEFPIAMDYDVPTHRGLFASKSNVIQVFSIDRLTFKMQFRSDINLKNEGVNALEIRHDGKVFSSGGWDGRLRIFSWKSLRPLAVMEAHKGPINTIVSSTEAISLWSKPIIAAAGNDGMISLWDLYN